MTVKEFIRRYGKVGINGPTYRGGPQPSFDEYRINESAFADELRVKSVYFELTDEDIFIDWESQEWTNDYFDLKEEIKRCYSCLARKYQLNDKFIISVYLYDRDGEGTQKFSIVINE